MILQCLFSPPTFLVSGVHLRLPSNFPRANSRFPPSIILQRPRLSSARSGKKKRSDVVDAEFSIVDDEERIGDGENDDDLAEQEEEEDRAWEGEFRAKEDEKDYDRDPELAELLGSFFEDPQNAQSRVEERIRKKRDKIVQNKAGSDKPMKVVFNKFEFTNSYIWFEFYNSPLPNDISLVCDTLRSWHIIGRLGGCNSMNMQAPLENKRPNYDAIQGANVTPATFYNIGDLEIQDNLARIWVDIGTSEPLLLDVLVNALININNDYVGVKQLMFGGKEFESWKENLASEGAGCSVHKI